MLYGGELVGFLIEIGINSMLLEPAAHLKYSHGSTLLPKRLKTWTFQQNVATDAKNIILTQ